MRDDVGNKGERQRRKTSITDREISKVIEVIVGKLFVY